MSPSNVSAIRSRLKEVAEGTLNALEHGSFDLNGSTHDLNAKVEALRRDTKYYSPDSLLSSWSKSTPPSPRKPDAQTLISIVEISTLEGARYAHSLIQPVPGPAQKIGVLNFASAKKPGGGFLTGAQAQEESIARSSSLYPSLLTDNGQQFYTLHKKDPRSGYYTHAMVYSPGVLLFRDDRGDWVEPLEVDVLTSPAVNAGVVRQSHKNMLTPQSIESRIATYMKERMARILYLFEMQGVKNLVLGSFGTGVFKNNVDVVARIWAELLTNKTARFKDSFDRVVFAIIGKSTFEEFERVFQETTAKESAAVG
ncbi:hypothetical protein K435DRAFT_773390 [Dendrothele bispora CBS 962.96]|uniref:Microbial-type PARG catalytic domain-containing protein n=1 Tax=Dendrothele bispora (strain CBS 962.96) TaxID=1314807 RepID=A0A4S8MU25_DENBC|nr:hypothetical protein K435DRAFT_773390 [Dendrothele bispora CBS 962.96]